MPASRGYRLAPLAEADLEDIWLYSFANWSIEQADRYHAGIVRRSKRLRAEERQDVRSTSATATSSIPWALTSSTVA